MSAKSEHQRGVLLDRNTVRFERTLPGPIELVWEYLTKQDLLSKWLMDGEIDPRPGSTFVLSQDTGRIPIHGDGEIRGVVTRSEPPRLLAYTWRSASPRAAGAPSRDAAAASRSAEVSEVTIELEPVAPDQVRLRLTHRRIESNHVPQAGAGWHTHLAFLHDRIRDRKSTSFFTTYEKVLPHYVRACYRLAHPPAPRSRTWIHLPVADTQRALAFYTGPAGFTAVGPDRPDARDTAAVYRADHPEVLLVLHAREGDATAPKNHEPVRVIFETKDLAREVRALTKRGVIFSNPPRPVEPSMVEASFQDPDGNRIAFRELNSSSGGPVATYH